MNDYLFPRPDPRLQKAMAGLLDTIERTFPMPERFRLALPRELRDLSHSLTDERSRREDGYLGQIGPLSAYLRYFLPWNVYRLARLLPALDLPLSADDAIDDLGSGPLTFPIALHLARPDLRTVPLEIRCLDRTAKVLEAGLRLFHAVAPESPWRVRTIRGSLGHTRIEGKPAALVSAVNVLNELFWDQRLPVEAQAARTVQDLAALADPRSGLLVVEPGIPRSGQYVSAMRAALLKDGASVEAPCPHAGLCPLPGGRGQKWCHFAFDSDDAPAALHRLSAAAGIPKERATLSFLYARLGAPAAAAVSAAGEALPVRVISDAFPVPGVGLGRYGCSARGLVLLTGGEVRQKESGLFIPVDAAKQGERKDKKSGAFIVSLGPTAFAGKQTDIKGRPRTSSDSRKRENAPSPRKKGPRKS